MNSKDYWEKREAEALKHRIAEEKEFDKQLHKIYEDMLDKVQNEINAFYGRYASKEGISIAEAKKRVSKADIKAYERKAKRYVKEREFSAEANEEMRLYNLMMKVNRLEMLKANIGLELIAGHDEIKKFMEGILQGRTEDELKRQAGLLGKSITNNGKAARVIVNASFHNATFSDRIWMHQDLLKAEIGKSLQSGMIQGRNPRVLAKDIEKKFGVSQRNAERLMRTELARVQTEAQKESFIRNGFSMYTFHTNTGCCDVCAALNGKHFKISKMQYGYNAPPVHPHCRCSTSAYEDTEEYNEWLDYVSKGGSTSEWNKMRAKSAKKDIAKSSKSSTMELKNIKVHKSVGAAGKNYPVKLPDGNHAKLAEGTEITKIRAFAGAGTDSEIRDRFRLESIYKIEAEKWQKMRGDAYVVRDGKNVHVEIHWYEADGERVEMKVKRECDES